MKTFSVFACFALCAAGLSATEYSLDFSGAEAESAAAPAIRQAAGEAAAPRLESLASGDTLHIKFFEDAERTLQIADALPGFANERSFAAHIGDGLLASLVVIRPGGCFIEVRDPAAARLYRASIAGGAARCEEIDLAAIPHGRCMDACQDDLEPDEADATQSAGAAMRAGKLLGAVPGNPYDDNIAAPAPVMIDLMLVFDNGAREWVEASEKYSSITDFAVVQVAKMNTALANNGLHTNFWFRLVDIATIDWKWQAINDSILPAVEAGMWLGTGPYADLSRRREACGADLVSFMIDTGTAYGTTGIGYIMHGTTYAEWTSATQKRWSYSACAIRSVDLEYTLLHEIGHNMGLSHSPTLPTWEPKADNFPYANGYNFFGADKKPYHTIMAYNYDNLGWGYIEIPYFSSPDFAYQGVAIGTANSNDCTRALRQTCVGVADRRAQVLPLPSDIEFFPASQDSAIVSLSTPGGYPIRYTLDGSVPTAASPLYDGAPLVLDRETTITAAAEIGDGEFGAVAAKTYSATLPGGKYALLSTSSDNWTRGDWRDQDGGKVDAASWYTQTDATAVLANSGGIEVNTSLSLGALVIANPDCGKIVFSRKLAATNLTVAGAATLYGTQFDFQTWKLLPKAKIAISPGANQICVFANSLDASDASALFAVTNGTVQIAGTANTRFGKAAVAVQNGGVLENMTGGWKLWGAGGDISIERGGTLKLDSMEAFQRRLVMNGGTLESLVNAARAIEFRAGSSIQCRENSTIADLSAGGAGCIYPCNANLNIAVESGKRLAMDMRLANSTDRNLSTGAEGFEKYGAGELRLMRESRLAGTNTIYAGTVAVAAASTATYGGAWRIAGLGTLKIERGASLATGALAFNSGATLELPASASAPLSAASAINLAGMRLVLDGADDLSAGARYPLVAAPGFSGVESIDKTSLPALESGLEWAFDAGEGVLAACVVHPDFEIAAGEEKELAGLPFGARRLRGAGTLVCGASLPGDIDLTNALWRGTVRFEGLNYGDATKDFQFEKYGNAASAIELRNCKISYLKNNGAHFPGTLVLRGSAPFSTNNGYSNAWNSFGALEGESAMVFESAQSQTYVFNTASNYTGAITIGAAMNNNNIAGRRIVFGSVATTNDIPSAPASITLQANATAAIGASAAWRAYGGVAIAGTLLVKGPGASLACTGTGDAAHGIALSAGALLRFDSQDATLAFAGTPAFASGVVGIALGDGVAPRDGMRVITWPAAPAGDGTFALAPALDGWKAVADAEGVVLKKTAPANSLAIGENGAYIAWDEALQEWMEEKGLEWQQYEYPLLTWQEFMTSADYQAANGYPLWVCYALGLDNTWRKDDTLKTNIEIKDGKVVITTAENARRLEGLTLWTTLYGAEELVSPLPEIKSVEGTTIELPQGAKGFYSVEVEFK